MSDTGGKSGWATIFVILLIGCLGMTDTVQNALKKLFARPAAATVSANAAPVASPVAPDSNLLIDTSQISLFDMRMEKSAKFSISGDLRPIWTVNGRIKNDSAMDLKEVKIEVDLFTLKTMERIDSAFITVSSFVPAMGVTAFRQEIHLQPGREPSTWSAVVVAATIEPRGSASAR
jgi:C4-dicarboxylate transporter